MSSEMWSIITDYELVQSYSTIAGSDTWDLQHLTNLELR